MSLFLKRTRGSMTVMVSLILIPTIFFTGFMVDLARIKLYGNQAVMTADNYGEAVISTYDNLLKELYGLFAVAQSEEGKKALDELDAYIQSSFTPNENTISQQYLQSIFGTTSYSGFMPYNQADVTLSYEPVSGANLDTNAVLSTQIGDFMKFRIVQTLEGSGSTIMSAVSEVQNMANNSKAIDKKCDLDEKAEEVVDTVKDFYEQLERVAKYPDYIDHMNSSYDSAKRIFNDVVNSDSYRRFCDYKNNEASINAALEKQKKLKKGQTLSAEDQKYIDMYNEYQNDGNARQSYFSARFDEAIALFENSTNYDPVDFDNYEREVINLGRVAQKVKKKFGELDTLRKELQAVLNDEKVSESIRTGMKQELARLDAMFEVNGKYSADQYINLAKAISDHTYQNKDYEQVANNIILRMEEIASDYLWLRPVKGWKDKLNENNWYYFTSNRTYKELYDNLKNLFDDNAGKTAEKVAKAKKKEAKKTLENAQKNLSKTETSEARDIPASFHMGAKGSVGEFALTKMVKTATAYFTSGSFSSAGNKLLLHLYTVQYDFGMFSSRVTGVKKDDTGKVEEAVSLTGYEISKNINYLYGAELEYLFGGFNSSDANLSDARNKILSFRAIVNFAATYAVPEVHNTIETIASAAAVINPALGLVVSGALRLAVAGLETVADWDLLKDGEAVVVTKSQLNDLTAFDAVANLVGLPYSDKQTGSSTGLKLDYEQYLMVMLMFLTSPNDIAERTGNLICLNVNTVQQNIGEKGTLSKLEFKLKDAATAVNATCAVHLDFVVIPDGFAEKMVDTHTYNQLNDYEQSTYKFTVTRGY